MSKSRVALKFSVRCFEAIPPARLPDGRTFEGVPRHWRMYDDHERVIASGPYESEPLILALIKLSARYAAEKPRESRELVGSLQHIKRKFHIVGPNGVPIETQPNLVRTADGKLKPNESILIN